MTPSIHAALLALAPLLGPAPLQDDEIERPEAWPEVAGKERKQIQVEIQKLRKARTPEMAEDAEEALVSGSLAAVPELLPALAREKDREARARIERVLERMTGPAHTRVLALEFDHKEGEARTWCLRRAARFPDAGIRAAAEAALARVRERGKRADPEELYAAALCATSAGSPEGLDAVFARAREAWPERGEEIRIALGAVRGPEAAGRAAGLLAGDPAEDRMRIVTGLRLLSGCGDPESAKRVLPWLDSGDNQIRVAAINAARGIVDGDGPMEELSVFRAIEVAKMWKRRIGGGQ